MRILFTSTGSWGTGSFTVIDALVEELVQQGHQVKVFFPDNPHINQDNRQHHPHAAYYHTWPFPLTEGDITLPTFPLMIADPHPRNPNPCLFKNLSSEQLNLYFSSFAQQIKSIIADFKPDVIESEHIWAMGYVLHQLGYPYIGVAHHSDQMGFHYDTRMQAYAKQMAHGAKHIFAISEHVKAEVCKLYALTENKVAVLGNGYDKRVFKSSDVDRDALLQQFDLELPANAQLITFSGKLSRTKGVDILLRANQLLAEQRNIHFLMLGAGVLSDVLDDQHDYCLERVHLLGHQPSETVAQLHNIAKLNVMPSRQEGFGIAGLEAMACGLPLVVTRCGGPDSYAVGEIIDIENPQQLAGAIEHILDLPAADYQALKEQAQQKAQAYSWRHITAQRLEYYQQVINQYGKP